MDIGGRASDRQSGMGARADITSLGRFVALMLAACVLVVGCALLVAIDQPAAAVATGAVTLAGFLAGFLRGAVTIPRLRLAGAEESARTGLTLVLGGGSVVVMGVVLFAAGRLVPGTIFAATAAAGVALGAGMLNAARMLRLVPTLIGHDEAPRAIALGANAMPGRPRLLVVATDTRIAWARGRRLAGRRAVRLEDVERFAADHATGTLTVVARGEELRVRPVARRELETFERLLRR